MSVGLLFSVVRFPSRTDTDDQQERSLAAETSSEDEDNDLPVVSETDSVQTTDSTADSPVQAETPPSSMQPLAESNREYRPAPLPKEAEVDPRLLREAEQAVARLKRKISKLNQNESWLDKYGGTGWQDARSALKEAEESTDPQTTIELVARANQSIDFSLPAMQYEEYLAETRGKTPAEMLHAQVAFRGKYPDHPDLPDIEASVARLSHRDWMAMATEQLQDASPDDSGFVEGWLPIAGAWQLVGNDAEAREAIRRAREALPRMAQVERIIESTIDLCQHESFDPASSEQLIRNAVEMCEQVSNKWDRGTYYAQLSGLARKLKQQDLSSEFLARSLALIEKDGLGSVWQKLTLTQQARAASWTEPPESIFVICSKIEKLNYPEPVINANAYAHAAMAAARRNDRTQFLKAMFLAENALAPVRLYDHPNYLYAARLAEANLIQRRWRAAVIIANNIPDPYIRASLLFRIMKDAPQEVRTRNLTELFQRFSEQRWASPACASHAEHRIRSGESLLSVAEWTQSLPLASQRAAAFSGIARSIGTTSAIEDTRNERPLIVPVDINDSHSLMEAAERIAHQIQEPLDSAFVWLQIARTWNLMGKTTRYRAAVNHLDDRLFDAWTIIWNERPPVKRSYNGGYIDSNDRHQDEEQRIIGLIIACHRHLAAMQADLGDSRGAMESCLNLANAAGFMNATATDNDLNFLQMKALFNRLEEATRVGPDAIPLSKHRSYRYTRALMAAWAKDIPGLEAALPDLVEHSHRRLGSASERAQPARAYGELAILYAERGNTDGYRKARRSAQSLITQGRAGSEMKLVLATADALAGEFSLAESNLVRGTLGWFGDANRPRKQLAISLAADGQWKNALDHAANVSPNQTLYRAEAWAAVAEARLKDGSQKRNEILDWVESIKSPVDKAAAYCGLGLASVASQ